MYNIRIYSILGLSLVAFVGLLVIQMNWLQKGIHLQEQKFNHRMCVLLQQVSQRIEEDSTLREQLIGFLKSAEDSSQNLIYPSKESEIDQRMRQVIDAFLTREKINISYEYAFYKKALNCGEEQPKQTEQQLYNLQLGNRVNQKLHRSCASSQLIHLGLLFPDKYQYLLKQVSSHLVIALIFILMLLACFAYTIHTIYYQKKFDRLKNDFINNLTHEFKTPIFSISLIGKVFRQNLEKEISPERAYHYLDLIEGENEQLKSHVEKVLQLAYLENARFELDLQAKDLHKIIHKVAKFFDFLVSQRNGSLKLDLQAQNTQIEVDETHLSNVLYNLLDNALKYSQDAPEIEISTQDQKEGIQLIVKDKGIGISQPDQAHIFEKFYRVSTGNVHQVKGFGLGLSYVKLVVEAHKGLIQLKSKLNKGTEFQLFLPKNV